MDSKLNSVATLTNNMKGTNTPKIKPDDKYTSKLIGSENSNLFRNLING
jgi:hypothetical protein